MNQRNQRGFVLTVVIVFLVLATLVAASTAKLTRTDLQVVQNGKLSAQSLYVAEGGIAEAMLRLEMANPTNITVNGRTFDASIVPDPANPNWKGQILLGSFAPGLSGSTFTTPTIQPTATQLLYTTTTADPETLTISWLKDSGGQIKTIQGRKVVQLVAVGRSGAARRKITQHSLVPLNVGFIALDPTTASCPTADFGSSTLQLYASVWVNSPCGTALSTKNSTVLNATGSINVVGGWNGSGSVSPTPRTGQAPIADPLASLPVPNFNDHVTRNGTPGNPSTLSITSNTTLQPGVYYGGISISGSATVNFAPGLYIMGGGGFSINGTSSVYPTMNAGGITIYNSKSVAGGGKSAAQFASFNFLGSANLNISAPTSGPYKGVLLFNDRANPEEVKLAGSGVSTFLLDGAFYAAGATVRMQGNPKNIRGDIVAYRFDFSSNLTALAPTTAIASSKYEQVAWQDY